MIWTGAPQPVWAELQSPRPLTDAELRLLTALVDVAGEPLLRSQAEDVVVDAVCQCGCSSLRLRTDGPAIPAQRVAALSNVGRGDYFAVHAQGVGAREHVSVSLHVTDGHIRELEIFDSLGGEGVAVPVSDLTAFAEAWLE